jgi:hypothetical protein
MIDIKVSQSEYKEFLKYYAWQLLQSSDYRLGQAFLNYFPKISIYLSRQGEEPKLYYETDNQIARRLIMQWIEKE